MRLWVAVALCIGCKSRAAPAEARVQRQMPVLEVAPAPVPSALPLAGQEGRDADGYPTRYVDRPALRSLLWHQRYQALDDALEQFQAAFEADARNEYWPIDAGDAFNSAEPSLKKRLDDWVAATPKSFAPYLARASYLLAVAGKRRGTKSASETPEEDWQAMREVVPRALDDLERALALRPKLVAAMRIELQLLRYDLGNGARMQAIIDRALAQCPGCFQVRVTHLFSLMPRWGGSYPQMAAFAGNAQKGKLRLLPGYIDYDKATALASQKRYPEARAAIERACALGDHWEFLAERGDIRERSEDIAGALADVERALALRPGLPRLVFARAEVAYMQRRWETAGRDLLEGLRSDPTDSTARWLYDNVVKGITYDGWEAHKAGRRDDAVRLLELAYALAPNNQDVSRRRAWAILGKPENADDTAALEAVVAQRPDDFRAVQQLDYAWSKQGGKYDQIVAMWTRYLARHADDGAAYLERGGAYHHLGKRAEALADAQKSCELGMTKGCEVAKRLR